MTMRGETPKLAGASGARPASIRRATRTRQERGLRTEAAILDATLRSLATRGIHETSLDLIAAEVGVAKSSILWHFGSKEELLLRVAERAFTMMEHGPAQEILARPTLRARGEGMWRVFTEMIQHFPEARRVVLYLIFAAGEKRPELRHGLQRLYDDMRTLLAAGLRDVVPDAHSRQTLATLAVAALDGIFLQWMIDPDALDLPALHRQIRRMAESATRPRKSKKKGS